MKVTYSYKVNMWGVTRTIRNNKKGYQDPQLGRSNLVEGVSEKSKLNLNKGFKKNNKISKTSRNQIIERVRLLALVANRKYYKSKRGFILDYKIQMITLTFKNHVEEKTSKRYLNTWLTNMRKTYQMENYVWRMEFQKRGVVHFHIVTDAALTLDITHKTWNQILEKNGHYGAMEWNSTDVKRFNNYSTYIAKYAGKLNEDNEDEIPVTGRYWGASQSLDLKELKMKLKQSAEFLYYYFLNGFYQAKNKLMRVKHKITDYCEMLFVPVESMWAWCGLITKDFRAIFLRHVKPHPSCCTQYNEEIQTYFGVGGDQLLMDF